MENFLLESLDTESSKRKVTNYSLSGALAANFDLQATWDTT